MERMPAWIPVLAAVVFVGLAVWSTTEENWSGLIVGLVLAALCVGWVMKRRSTSS
jgi:hypothetical protein